VSAVEPLSLMPDVERLVIDALIDDPDVAAVCAGRVYGAVPNNKVFPLIRVVRYGGQMIDDGDPWWADAPAVQIDTWADRKAEAVGLAEIVRAVCAQRLKGTHSAGVVAGVGIGTSVYDPDESFTPAKPRVRLSVDLVTRPASSSTRSPGAAAPRRTEQTGPPPVGKQDRDA
jgi:hypothetical protein